MQLTIAAFNEAVIVIRRLLKIEAEFEVSAQLLQLSQKLEEIDRENHKKLEAFAREHGKTREDGTTIDIPKEKVKEFVAQKIMIPEEFNGTFQFLTKYKMSAEDIAHIAFLVFEQPNPKAKDV